MAGPSEQEVTVSMYSVLGELVGSKELGVLQDRDYSIVLDSLRIDVEGPDGSTESAPIDATKIPAGVYFYKIDYGTHVLSKKMVLLK